MPDPTTADRLRSAAAALDAVAAARTQRDQAEATFRAAIIAAMGDRTGVVVNQIAKAAGVSRVRVHQIVKEGVR